MPFICPYCRRVFGSLIALRAHAHASHSKVCPVCGRRVLRMSSHLRLDDKEHRLFAFIFYRSKNAKKCFPLEREAFLKALKVPTAC